MSQEQFAALIPFISDDLTSAISRNEGIPEEDAVMKLYGSRLYALLEKEETKLWQYSTEMLYSLYKQEQRSGSLEFPDT